MNTKQMRYLLSFALALCAGVAVWSMAQSRETSAPYRGAERTAFRPSRPEPEKAAGTTSRPLRARSLPVLRANLFSPQLPPPTPHPVAPKPTPPPAPPVLPAPPVDPLADYLYNGMVTIEGQSWALIENRKTQEGWFVKAGESFQGYPVVSVTAQALTLTVNGTTRALTKSEAINLTPLVKDKSARIDSAPASDSVQPIALTFNTVTSAHLTYLAWAGGLSSAEISHLKDEVFEGRMTLDEYERRVGQSAPPDKWGGLQRQPVYRLKTF